MNNTTLVYVAILNEGIDVWRPVQAEHVADDLYRLIGEQPDDEAWPFAIGDVVRCKSRTLSGERGRSKSLLVAYERT